MIDIIERIICLLHVDPENICQLTVLLFCDAVLRLFMIMNGIMGP